MRRRFLVSILLLILLSNTCVNAYPLFIESKTAKTNRIDELQSSFLGRLIDRIRSKISERVIERHMEKRFKRFSIDSQLQEIPGIDVYFNSIIMIIGVGVGIGLGIIPITGKPLYPPIPMFFLLSGLFYVVIIPLSNLSTHTVIAGFSSIFVAGYTGLLSMVTPTGLGLIYGPIILGVGYSPRIFVCEKNASIMEIKDL